MTQVAPSHKSTQRHDHTAVHKHQAAIAPSRSVLAWPAWLRVAAVSPLILLLWLAVWWTNVGIQPW